MKKRTITYKGGPLRLDFFMAENMNLSREFAKRMIRSGEITVNAAPKKPSYVLKDGDIVDLNPKARKTSLNLSDFILTEEKDFLAICKPVSLASHPNDPNWEADPDTLSLCEPTVASLVRNYLPENAGLPRMGLVHRLDRETSGIMIIAKTFSFLSHIRNLFESRKVKKTYAGVVSGLPESESGEIEAPVGRPPKRKKFSVWQYGKYALTKFRVKEKAAAAALLEIYPLTGRTNQIRVHFSHIGLPIWGDALYGDGRAKRMLLHSEKISFEGLSGKKVGIESPLPEDFLSEWEKVKRLKL